MQNLKIKWYNYQFSVGLMYFIHSVDLSGKIKPTRKIVIFYVHLL